jgi:hypothetical protein
MGFFQRYAAKFDFRREKEKYSQSNFKINFKLFFYLNIFKIIFFNLKKGDSL